MHLLVHMIKKASRPLSDRNTMIQASVSKSSKMGIRGRSLDIVTTQETVKLFEARRDICI